jgi:diguanylate cyclase (GGDEF)-like protein
MHPLVADSLIETRQRLPDERRLPRDKSRLYDFSAYCIQVRARDGEKNYRMISLKKYLDMDTPLGSFEVEADPLATAMLESYSAALSVVGDVAVKIGPTLGTDLRANLEGLKRRLATDPGVDLARRTERLVEIQLQEWGDRTAAHLKDKADEVKELLITLANTAESVWSRDEGYTNKFKDLTGRIEQIANLDDLTQIRSSIVRGVSELKSSVDQMTRDSQEMVTNLRTEVSTYEARLKAIEYVMLKDELTRVENRRSVECRIHSSIANQAAFCVLMIDLNHFKQVNDKYGHFAGDDLLKQFAMELQLNVRSSDLVGRWAGDEFILVLACDGDGARMQIDRIREWVFGKYTIRGGPGKEPVSIQVDASIGMAEWKPNKTLEQIIEEADVSMYMDKNSTRGSNRLSPSAR